MKSWSCFAMRLRGRGPLALTQPWSQLGRDPFLLETNVPGVFAVGDVRSGGTRMAAPAVGEGGMAVRFAAEHFARTSPEPT
jgi:thioredoxin reductase